MSKFGTFIAGLRKVQGSQGGVTLARKQIIEVLKEEGNYTDEIGELLSNFKNPKLDLAYKASERGFTVGALRLRDGKQVLATGAASITDSANGIPIFKMRTSIGPKGKYSSARGSFDIAQDIDPSKLSLNIGLNDGVLKCSANAGNMTQLSGYTNYKLLLDDLGEFGKRYFPDNKDLETLSYSKIMDVAKSTIQKTQQKMRDVFYSNKSNNTENFVETSPILEAFNKIVNKL